MGTTIDTLLRVLTTLLFCLPYGTVYGDEWASIAQTELFIHRNYMLRILPDPKPADKPGHCKATLYRRPKAIRRRRFGLVT